jgi:hypothetical protein
MPVSPIPAAVLTLLFFNSAFFQDSARNHLYVFLAVSQIPLLSRLFLDKNKSSVRSL